MVEIKVLIKTPVGYAKTTEYKLRKFLIGNKGHLHKIMTTPEDDKILWIVEANPRQYMKIIRNVGGYKSMISGILKNKTVRKVAKLDQDQINELDKMLNDQTEIDLIKENEWQEIKKEFVYI